MVGGCLVYVVQGTLSYENRDARVLDRMCNGYTQHSLISPLHKVIKVASTKIFAKIILIVAHMECQENAEYH